MNLGGRKHKYSVHKRRFIYLNLIFIHLYLPIQSLNRGLEKSPIIWGKLGSLSVQYNSVFSSVQFSHSVMSDSLWPHELQHTRPPYPSPTPRVHPNSCPLSRWCHLTISSSVIPFSSCPQSIHSIRVFSNESTLHMRWPKYWSFSFSISPSNELPGLISFRVDWLDLLVSKGLSRVFSSTTVQKHQFFSVQLSL